MIPVVKSAVAAMSKENIEKVRSLESEAMKMPQAEIETIHTFHAGVYARTVKIPAGIMITGALIKIPTLIILSGNAQVFTEDGSINMSGYHVLNGAPGRKQVFIAIEDTSLTMLFPTEAKTVEEAEAEFTDETHLLITNREGA